MFPFRRKDEPKIPHEAQEARREADDNYAEALTKLAEAKKLGGELAGIRARNHFAESLTTVFGGKKHGHS